MRLRVAIALVLVALLFSAGCDSSPMGATAEKTPVRVTMFMTDIQPEVVDSFLAGQSVRAKDSGALIGRIVSVDATYTAMSVGDAEGGLHEARSPVTRDVVLVLEGDAVVSDAGYRFDGTFQYINNETVFLTPYTQFLGIITGMEPSED